VPEDADSLPVGGREPRPIDFEIAITRQGWIDGGPDSERADLCSHGDIRLVIGGRVVARGTGSREYTISTSALALLRTLESDHESGEPIQQLILHCGMLLMTSCPIGIDWSVRHTEGRVELSNLLLCEEIGSVEEFPGLAASVTEDRYRREVIAFAKKAKELFANAEKIFPDELERQLYDEFWREYDARLDRALEASGGFRG